MVFVTRWEEWERLVKQSKEAYRFVIENSGDQTFVSPQVMDFVRSEKSTAPPKPYTITDLYFLVGNYIHRSSAIAPLVDGEADPRYFVMSKDWVYSNDANTHLYNQMQDCAEILREYLIFTCGDCIRESLQCFDDSDKAVLVEALYQNQIQQFPNRKFRSDLKEKIAEAMEDFWQLARSDETPPPMIAQLFDEWVKWVDPKLIDRQLQAMWHPRGGTERH